MEDYQGRVFWFLIELILVGTGRIVLALATFGRWRGERGSEGRTFGPAGALSFKHQDQRVITKNGFFIAGVLFYVALVCLFVWFTSTP